MGDDAGKGQRDATPWGLLITVLVLVLTFFIVMPVMGFMYVDLLHLREVMKLEIRKMKELRRDVLIERSAKQ